MDRFIGEIFLLPYNFAPRNMVVCDGRQLPISQHQELFALLGTNFGGDGKTTFALPDLREKSPLEGLTYYISLAGIFPTRD